MVESALKRDHFSYIIPQTSVPRVFIHSIIESHTPNVRLHIPKPLNRRYEYFTVKYFDQFPF